MFDSASVNSISSIPSPVPMKESFPSEHSRELLGNSLEDLLDGGGVTHEGGGHLETSGGNVAHAGHHVVGDPLHEVGGVLVLHVQHLLIHLLRRHAPAEERRSREVAAVSRVSRAHHIFGIKHLLRELRNRESTVLLRAARGQRSEAGHEEVEPREGDEVHRDLPEVAIELPGKAEARRNTAHGCAHQMVEVPICWRRELQRAEAYVIERLVVEEEALVGVLDELMEGQDGVIGLHHGVRDLRRGDYREGLYDAVRVLLANFRDEQRAHTRTSAATEGVADLETLQAVTSLC